MKELSLSHDWHSIPVEHIENLRRLLLGQSHKPQSSSKTILFFPEKVIIQPESSIVNILERIFKEVL